MRVEVKLYDDLSLTHCWESDHSENSFYCQEAAVCHLLQKARTALLPRGNQNNWRVSCLSPHSQQNSREVQEVLQQDKNESQPQENKVLLLKACFSLSNRSQSTALAEEVEEPLTYPHLQFAISFMHLSFNRTRSNGKDLILPYFLATSTLNTKWKCYHHFPLGSPPNQKNQAVCSHKTAEAICS